MQQVQLHSINQQNDTIMKPNFQVQIQKTSKFTFDAIISLYSRTEQYFGKTIQKQIVKRRSLRSQFQLQMEKNEEDIGYSILQEYKKLYLSENSQYIFEEGEREILIYEGLKLIASSIEKFEMKTGYKKSNQIRRFLTKLLLQLSNILVQKIYLKENNEQFQLFVSKIYEVLIADQVILRHQQLKTKTTGKAKQLKKNLNFEVPLLVSNKKIDYRFYLIFQIFQKQLLQIQKNTQIFIQKSIDRVSTQIIKLLNRLMKQQKNNVLSILIKTVCNCLDCYELPIVYLFFGEIFSSVQINFSYNYPAYNKKENLMKINKEMFCINNIQILLDTIVKVEKNSFSGIFVQDFLFESQSSHKIDCTYCNVNTDKFICLNLQQLDSSQTEIIKFFFCKYCIQQTNGDKLNQDQLHNVILQKQFQKKLLLPFTQSIYNRQQFELDSLKKHKQSHHIILSYLLGNNKINKIKEVSLNNQKYSDQVNSLRILSMFYIQGFGQNNNKKSKQSNLSEKYHLIVIHKKILSIIIAMMNSQNQNIRFQIFRNLQASSFISSLRLYLSLGQFQQFFESESTQISLKNLLNIYQYIDEVKIKMIILIKQIIIRLNDCSHKVKNEALKLVEQMNKKYGSIKVKQFLIEKNMGIMQNNSNINKNYDNLLTINENKIDKLSKYQSCDLNKQIKKIIKQQTQLSLDDCEMLHLLLRKNMLLQCEVNLDKKKSLHPFVLYWQNITKFKQILQFIEKQITHCHVDSLNIYIKLYVTISKQLKQESNIEKMFILYKRFYEIKKNNYDENKQNNQREQQFILRALKTLSLIVIESQQSVYVSSMTKIYGELKKQYMEKFLDNFNTISDSMLEQFYQITYNFLREDIINMHQVSSIIFYGLLTKNKKVNYDTYSFLKYANSKGIDTMMLMNFQNSILECFNIVEKSNSLFYLDQEIFKNSFCFSQINKINYKAQTIFLVKDLKEIKIRSTFIKKLGEFLESKGHFINKAEQSFEIFCFVFKILQNLKEIDIYEYHQILFVLEKFIKQYYLSTNFINDEENEDNVNEQKLSCQKVQSKIYTLLIIGQCLYLMIKLLNQKKLKKVKKQVQNLIEKKKFTSVTINVPVNMNIHSSQQQQTEYHQKNYQSCSKYFSNIKALKESFQNQEYKKQLIQMLLNVQMMTEKMYDIIFGNQNPRFNSQNVKQVVKKKKKTKKINYQGQSDTESEDENSQFSDVSSFNQFESTSDSLTKETLNKKTKKINENSQNKMENDSIQTKKVILKKNKVSSYSLPKKLERNLSVIKQNNEDHTYLDDMSKNRRSKRIATRHRCKVTFQVQQFTN